MSDQENGPRSGRSWARNPLRRLPDWIRQVFFLADRDVPNSVLLPEIAPVLNVLDVASRAIADTLTVGAAPASAQFPDVVGALVTIQADPGNAGNALLGFGNGMLPIVMPPGTVLEATVANLNLFFGGSSGAFPVTFNWIVLQPV